ncbi:MAG: NUDIX hydrolase [Patescibacteria group bacterium]|nr:NUDIX hydrolase [Patescibacteria group bacterium]
MEIKIIMQLKTIYTNRSGQKLNIIYSEDDPLLDIKDKILQDVHAFCFYGDKMVLVKHPKSGWIPPGGRIESGESIEEALIREVKEETNMRITHQKVIGFQDIYEPEKTIRQVRSFCTVEPYGDFASDPDGDITEIKLIDPKEYKKYFDWGEISDRIMKQAMLLLPNSQPL